nr:hypothetical protein [uncultured Draconibacterium sp.]
MKLYLTCKYCKKELSKWLWVSDRVELKKDKGDSIELFCKKCNNWEKYDIDNLKAQESKVALIISLLIFSIGTPTILFLLWDYIWLTGVSSIVGILSIVLTPSIIYGIINRQIESEHLIDANF